MPGRAIIAALALAAAPALAEEAAPPRRIATFGIERHATGNALDRPVALPDGYTVLRGSLSDGWAVDGGHVRLSGSFEATKFDRYAFEDDAALALAAELFRQLRPGLEMRGALSLRVAEEGDDVAIGPLTLGTRTSLQTIGASLEVGADVGPGATLVLQLADSFQHAGRTRFEGGPLAPRKLKPDENRLSVGARLTRTRGAFALGASAAATVATIERIGEPPSSVSFAEYTLRLEAGIERKDGFKLGLAAGLQLLDGADDTFSEVRPTGQLTFVKPLGDGTQIRGMLAARFETADSDDPLGSWLRRAEIEATRTLGNRLTLGAGLFLERKENLLFENEERRRGFYAEASYPVTDAVAIAFRIDTTRTFATVIDRTKRSTDIFLAVRSKI